MINYKDENGNAVWDFMIVNGIQKVLDGEGASKQRAIIATFLQRGTVPQIPSLGNQWAELLTGEIQPNQLNAQVRNSIIENTNELKYIPKYSIVNGKLNVEVKEI